MACTYPRGGGGSISLQHNYDRMVCTYPRGGEGNQYPYNTTMTEWPVHIPEGGGGQYLYNTLTEWPGGKVQNVISKRCGSRPKHL